MALSHEGSGILGAKLNSRLCSRGNLASIFLRKALSLDPFAVILLDHEFVLSDSSAE